ncbi:hypothetical protein HLBENOHH_01945 [Aeromonas dhakensis]
MPPPFLKLVSSHKRQAMGVRDPLMGRYRLWDKGPVVETRKERLPHALRWWWWLEHFTVSQPFWLLARVCPHGQIYLSKLSPLGEGLGHRFTRQPRCLRPSPAKPTELCPGLLHRQGGWVFVPHGAYRGRFPHRCYSHGWGACVVVTLPLTDWLPSYDAKVDLSTFCIMPKIITQRGHSVNTKCDYFG